MKYSNETMLSFYRQLGKVFFAVASVSKTLRKEELSSLNNIVESKWLDFDFTFDEFGTDSAYQMEIVFDWLLDSNWNVKQAIPGLKSFKKEHASLFTKQVNELILKTANAIANSFPGKNKEDIVLINQLQDVLKN